MLVLLLLLLVCSADNRLRVLFGLGAAGAQVFRERTCVSMTIYDMYNPPSIVHACTGRACTVCGALG